MQLHNSYHDLVGRLDPADRILMRIPGKLRKHISRAHEHMFPPFENDILSTKTIGPAHVAMGPNFTACGIRYMSDPVLISNYNYSGCVRLVPAN